MTSTGLPAVKWCGSPLTAIGEAIVGRFHVLGWVLDGAKCVGTVTMSERQLRIDNAAGHTDHDFCVAFGLTESEKVCSQKVPYSPENLEKCIGLLKGKTAFTLPTDILKGEDGKALPGITFYGPEMSEVIATAMSAVATPRVRGTRTATAVAAPKELTPDEMIAQADEIRAQAEEKKALIAKAQELAEAKKAKEAAIAEAVAKAKADAEAAYDSGINGDPKVMSDTARTFVAPGREDGEKDKDYAHRVKAERKIWEAAS